MRLLDLFCGGGGAGTGYAWAGFEVVGVDIHPQPHYPFAFFQADALEFVAQHGREFDVIHASPPCQGYSHAVKSTNSPWVSYSQGKATPRLIRQVRAALLATGKPYVIENVIGSRDELAASILLCGSMFGIHPVRHRIFETSLFIWQPHHPACSGYDKRYAASVGMDYRDIKVTGKSRRAGCVDTWRSLLGAPWMVGSELAEAIPPAYTEWIGKQLLSVLQN